MNLFPPPKSISGKRDWLDRNGTSDFYRHRELILGSQLRMNWSELFILNSHISAALTPAQSDIRRLIHL